MALVHAIDYVAPIRVLKKLCMKHDRSDNSFKEDAVYTGTSSR